MKCAAFQRRQAEARARQQVPTTKEAFMISYVLNRASISSSLDGKGAAQEAAKAWEVIQAEKGKP